jgi:Protein of unknown function (DUF4197)
MAAQLTRLMGNSIKNVIHALALPGGYLDNPLVRILLPPPVRITLGIIREINSNQGLSPLEIVVNHAAEDSILQAVPILDAALQQITVQEARVLLDGGGAAVTNYLKEKTTQKLEKVLTTAISAKLEADKAQEKYQELVALTSQRTTDTSETLSEIEHDLPAYVAKQSVVGVFKLLEVKERDIRGNLESLNFMPTTR